MYSIQAENLRSYKDIINRLRRNPIEPSADKDSQSIKPNQNLVQRLNSTDFDDFQEENIPSYILEIFLCLGLIDFLKLNSVDGQSTFKKFVQVVKCNYNDNPFHNFTHGFMVLQMMFCLVCDNQLNNRLSPIDLLTLAISALCHDLDHPGISNAYQSAAMTQLAIKYNDTSILENHHCCKTFEILFDPSCCIITNLNYDQVMLLRGQIIKCIMATDVSKQSEILAKVKDTSSFDWKKQSDKVLGLQLLMKASDVSLEIRPVIISDEWVKRLFEEFSNEVKLFKLMSLCPPAHMDLTQTTIPEAQIGFISHVVLKLYEHLNLICPKVEQLYIPKIKKALQRYKQQFQEK